MGIEHRWNDASRGRINVPGEEHVAVPFCPPEVPRALAFD
jgi:hypothetical protein